MPTDHLIFDHDVLGIISILVVSVLVFLLWSRRQMLARLQRSEAKIRESEANLLAILNNSPESAMLMDENGVIIAANPIFGQRLGYDSATLIGRCVYDLIPPEVAERRKQYVAQALRIGQPVHFEDQRGESWISNYLQPVQDADGAVRRFAIFGADITERRRIEQFRQRQTDLLAAIRQAQSLFILHGEMSLVFRELLNILVSLTDSEYGFLDEVLYEPDGTPYKLSLALSDIAWDEDSRRLYEQLVARKLEFRNLNNLAGAPVLERRVVIANDAPRDPRYQGLPPGHPPLRRYLGIPLFFNEELIGVAGVANRAEGYDPDLVTFLEPLTNTCAHLIRAIRIQRESQQVAETLARSEEQYRRIVETANEGIWAMDSEYRTTFVNRRMADLLGYAPEEMLGQRVDAFMLAEDLGDHGAKMARRVQGEGSVYERRFRRKDGEALWTIVSATALRDENGQFAGSFAMFTDITQRKQGEEKLRQSEANLSALIENTDDIIVSRDREKRTIVFNSSFARIVQKLFGIEAEPGIRTTDYLPEPHRIHWENILDKTFAGESHREQFAWDFDGDIRYYELSLNPIRVGNEIIGSTEFTRDITDQKRIEESLRHSLEEKETLLREVHHRVKNNLAAIIGLLELQQSHQTDPQILMLLTEGSNRIRSMALVHEMLYQSGTLSQIDFHAYLQALVGQLCSSFDPYNAIHFSVAADGVWMDLDTAIPCGLIVNELVVNAFKYAFPPDQPRSSAGEISITVVQDGAAYQLVVADNGVGLPAGLDWTTTKTLGLRLVRMLGQHELQGQIEFNGAHGACFSLRFHARHLNAGMPHHQIHASK
jgi:PAS domain S-box-containing protein